MAARTSYDTSRARIIHVAIVPGGTIYRRAADACAFAGAVRDHLGRLLKTYELLRTRILYYDPFALAVFLGQQLTAVGEIQLFEYQDPGYVSSCTLRT